MQREQTGTLGPREHMNYPETDTELSLEATFVHMQ